MNEDKSTRYQRLRRRVAIASLAWSITLLVGLAWSGGAVWLRQLLAGLVGAGKPTLLVVLYVAALVLLHEAGALAWSFYGGHVLERRYGLHDED